jgi:hypothetical protein
MVWGQASQALLSSFVLYCIARSLDAWVVDNLSVVGGVVHWNVLFTRYA